MPAAYLRGSDSRLPANMPEIIPGCTGKVKFDSAVIAHEVASRKREVNRHSYRCKHCGKYHIGSPHNIISGKPHPLIKYDTK